MASQHTSVADQALEEHAAAKALSGPSRADPTPARSILDADGKLSSASAATSLKYAKPQNLPSFPSSGLPLSSAGAAASLAANNQKSIELWKAGEIPAANKAALLAKDYEAKPLWQPESSSAGAKAALLANKGALAKDAQRKAKEDEDAAVRKLAQQNIDRSREVDPEIHSKALKAASASVANRNRADSKSSQPAPAPASATSNWALKAATASAHNPPNVPPMDFAPGDPGFEAARIQNMSQSNVNRQLYGSSPPVALEVQEKNRQDTLRASAVAMAQKMYAAQQQQQREAASRPDSVSAARGARNSTFSDSSSGVTEGVYGGNLEEAARKLAQERLAKIHDEHAEYRQYYGASSPPKSRYSMRLGGRRRASSSAGGDDSDEETSRRIKSQMSLFTSKLQEVDNKKRQADRDALLQLAHKNVDKQMRSLDEEVFQSTGKASPAQLEVWEKAAREKAQRESDERMQYQGKVHIGGGKYLDQSEVDAIARARLQPTLDDISKKAEEQRARDEAIRVEKERAAALAAAEKQKHAEQKAESKAAADKEKAERKAREREIKEQQAQEKEKRKLLEANEKARLKAEKRKSKEIQEERASKPVVAAAVVAPEPKSEAVAVEGDTFHDQVTSPTTAPVTDASVVPDDQVEPISVVERPSTELAAAARGPTTAATGRKSLDTSEATGSESLSKSPQSSTSGKVKSWMKGRFRSKSNATNDGMVAVPEGAEDAPVAVAGKTSADHRPDSIRNVAMAGRNESEADDMYGSARPASTAQGPLASHPVTADAATTGVAAETTEHNRDRSISPVSPSETEASKTTGLKPTTEAAARPSTEVSDDERGRRGFRERLMNKITGTKDEPAANTTTTTTTTTTTAVGATPAKAADLPTTTTMHDPYTAPTQTTSLTGASALNAPVLSYNALATNTSDDDGEFQEAKDHFEEEKSTKTLPKVKSGESRFHEEL